MARWSRTLLALAAAALLAAPSAFAQGGGASSTGSISGEVKDEQGGVLPGVTVTATSPAQPGALTAVTNEAGIYRFPAVPPGRLRAHLRAAPASVPVTRDGIRITLGFNAQVNVNLRVATLQETVTVSGESPVIDTSATRLQTNFDQDRMNALPNARDMWSLLATTPSVTLNRVDVGGATMGTQTTYFAYGYSGQNRPLVEGINTTEGTAAAGFYLDYGSFEEVFIGAAANSAEMPNSGVLTQFVSKSGGNSPSLSVYYDMEDESIQSDNLAAGSGHPVAGREHPARRQPPGQLQEHQHRRRLPDPPRPHLGVRRLPRPAQLGGGAARRLVPRRHAVQHQAAQLHRQAHLPDEPEQQVRGLPPARHQDAAEPHRQQQQARRADPHHRRFDHPAGLAELGLQGRVERHAHAEHVRRVPRRPVRLQLRARQQHRRHPLRIGHAPTRCWAAAATGSCAGAATSTPARSATSRTTSRAARTT